ncbi:Putative phage tail protein [Sphingomonas laterariae]|uniref:Putative phage tail protein n=1 Tax=Edaphosphingomonas laterariae TaxID=861865 RepID=A0A239CBM5_9SPHN|nr:phage tail protein [Sphingomonas laterariae]SNS16844.1 Putative phage tail protein [Sphingomonas laterariae]
MATLVLTTVGSIVGGPIGGAIGAVLGQQIDQRWLAPKRHGPRLGELGLQTSSYGQPLPKLFGRMRVAGTVIWATDLREQRHRTGGSKGRPRTTTYSYSASFAVALSARPVRAVHRIWADGKLLRGAAGDWKSETGFRLYLGGEGQAIDPLIASVEGIGETPAYRGLAYALFEDFQLADYGNRIPSLTFEVEADEGAVSLGAIAADLSAGAMEGDTSAALEGFAATGDSVRGVIETLARAMPISVRDDGTRLLITDIADAPVNLSADEIGASADGRRGDRMTIERGATTALPDEVAIVYYEPARDYQAGLQRARRGGPGRRVERIELPAALAVGRAKAAAERRLMDMWAARERTGVRLSWRHLALRPGQRARVGGGAAMRVTGWTLDRMVLDLKLAGMAGGNLGQSAAPGGGVLEPDRPHGPTRMALLDLPPLEATVSTVPHIWVAAAGTMPGWRRAALSYSLNGGTSWEDIGPTAAPAIMGTTDTILPPGAVALIDEVGTVDVTLANTDMILTGRDDAALINGANLAMIGAELIQFGRADPLGGRRYRLSRLLRGRRGTEPAMTSHAAGEGFTLIEAETLLPIELPAGAIGGRVDVMAIGVGDATPVMASATIGASALRPPPPVHLRMDAAVIRWTRRSRNGWSWIDGADAPLGEEAERYRLVIAPSVGNTRTVELSQPFYAYGAAERAADGAAEAPWLDVSVRQIGLGGASDAAIATLTV